MQTALPELLRKAVAESVRLGDRLLVAVSGGPDSMALLHLCRGLPYQVLVGHVDHALRAGSAADARFVAEQAHRLGFKAAIQRVDVRRYARANGLGIEEAARDQRYAALSAMARRCGCRAVLTAHTADDQAETVLMNWLRGAGPAGLAGMPPARPLEGGRVLLRPLLEVQRMDLLSFLKSQKGISRLDPTNRNTRFHRNRIRRVLLPSLLQAYPGLSGRLGQAAAIFREEEGFWRETIGRKLAKTVRKNGKNQLIDLTRLFGYHKALGRRILRHVLPGLSFQELERVFALARSPDAADSLHFGGGLLVARKGDKLIIQQSQRNS
jgi:tRNA(Ile)-lysidine synthase